MLNVHLNRQPIRRSTKIAVVGLLVAITAAVGTAQSAFATLSGSVYDSLGASIPNATVTLSNAERGSKYEIHSDATGSFEFVGLPPGNYMVEGHVPGFATTSDAVIIAGNNLHQDLRLQLGTLEETIVVQETNGASPPRSPSKTVAPRANSCVASQFGGKIRPPYKIKDVAPQYPESLRRSGVDGVVSLQARIGLDGFPTDIEVIDSPHPLLSDAAFTAVREWQFDQTLLNCVPIEPPMTVRVTFKQSATTQPAAKQSAANVGLTFGLALSKLAPRSESMNLQFQNAPLADVMRFLSVQSGIEFRFSPDVVATRPMNIHIINAKFEDVFGFLMTAAKLDYTVIDEKTVLITNKP